MQHVTSKHVLSALTKIDKDGVPRGREGRTYTLVYKGKRYPPKYVLTLANKIADGTDLLPDQLNGGQQTNSFLTLIGFSITENRSTRLLRLVLKTGYDVYNRDRKLTNAFRYLAKAIESDERYDFLITPGGHLHFKWPDSFKKVMSQEEGNIHLKTFTDTATIAFNKLWSTLSVKTRNTLAEKIKYISIGLDSCNDVKETKIQCIELVGLYDVRKAKFVPGRENLTLHNRIYAKD